MTECEVTFFPWIVFIPREVWALEWSDVPLVIRLVTRLLNSSKVSSSLFPGMQSSGLMSYKVQVYIFVLQCIAGQLSVARLNLPSQISHYHNSNCIIHVLLPLPYTCKYKMWNCQYHRMLFMKATSQTSLYNQVYTVSFYMLLLFSIWYSIMVQYVILAIIACNYQSNNWLR